MVLVSYSDSEGSDDDEQKPTAKPQPSAKLSSSNFSVDKSNPGKIKVNLQPTRDITVDNAHEDEPAAKRPRVGAGAFSGFNSMLPAPKKSNVTSQQSGTAKAPARKVFSLKTGAEASFSRESDAEFRQLFSEQSGSESIGSEPPVPKSNVPIPAFAKPPPPSTSSTPFMFKPLSVARHPNKKKKPVGNVQGGLSSGALLPVKTKQSSGAASAAEPPPRNKVSLFSTGEDTSVSIPEPQEVEDEYQNDDIDIQEPQLDEYNSSIINSHSNYTDTDAPQTQSLDSIASDLNLTAAQKRQLFGRNSSSKSKSMASASAINIVNFNTDEEYAHNQSLIAAGETIQHNPVRAIAPGKHSLKQLVNAASSQKDALEESFAEGRRNKKEAGNKYGW